MVVEDPLTGDYPSRQADLEEDEDAAQALVDQYTVKPVMNWLTGEAPVVNALVLLLGQGPALLAQTLFTEAQPSGTITVPELQRLRSPLEEEYGHAAVHVHTSTVAVTPGGLAVAASPRHLPAEQAVTWAEAVLAELNAPTVLIVTSLLASEFRGVGNAAEEELIFCLHTSAGQPVPGVAPLTSGTLVGGVAAAVLQRCELSSCPASALVAVEAAPVPDVGRVCGIAAAVCRALPAEAAGAVCAGKLLHARLAAELDAIYRSSASESMFI